MKQLILKIKLIFLFVLIFQSCSKSDDYYSLPEEAKSLILYEIGDTFKLKKISTDEIITLTVFSKEIDYYKESSSGNWGFGFGSGSDSYYERGHYSFSDESNYYDGTIFVDASSSKDSFEFTAYLNNSFGNYYETFAYQDEFLPSIEVDGIEYMDIYLIRAYSQVIFYSKENGIIKIDDIASQETLFIKVE
uniref:hypothetical protein n=2 Tax=Flavobacterium sp. TaxID=239 RepID=UPI004049C7FF